MIKQIIVIYRVIQKRLYINTVKNEIICLVKKNQRLIILCVSQVKLSIPYS